MIVVIILFIVIFLAAVMIPGGVDTITYDDKTHAEHKESTKGSVSYCNT